MPHLSRLERVLTGTGMAEMCNFFSPPPPPKKKNIRQIGCDQWRSQGFSTGGGGGATREREGVGRLIL